MKNKGIILIIDTAGSEARLVLGGEKHIIAERRGEIGPRLGTWLLTGIESLLKEADLEVNQLARVAVAEGPAVNLSALRVGAVTATTLAQTAGAEIAMLEAHEKEDLIKLAWSIKPTETVMLKYRDK